MIKEDVKRGRPFQRTVFNLQGPRAQVTCFNAQMVHAFHGPQRVAVTTFQFVKMDPTCLQLAVS